MGQPRVSRLFAPSQRLATPSILTVCLCAAVIAVLKSSEFLAQPFVWQNWSIADVMVGWAEIARDELIVAATLACALIAVLRLHLSLRLQALGVAGAIVAGAAAGEGLLMVIDPQAAASGAPALAARALRWVAIGGIVSVTYFYWRRDIAAAAGLRQAERRHAQAQKTAAAARLTALRRQIEPHFLFNTFATIRQLYQTGPVGGGRLLSHLLTFMRATLLSSEDTFSTLGREVDLAEAYLQVFSERMSGRLIVRVEVADDLRDLAFPPLTLATLVENAIKHGISPSPEGGSVVIRAVPDGDRLSVEVADTGVGFSGESGSGTGLANVRARLTALYGPTAACRIATNAPRGVVASLHIPHSPAGAVA